MTTHRLFALLLMLDTGLCGLACDATIPSRQEVLAASAPHMDCGTLTATLTLQCNDGRPEEASREEQRLAAGVEPGRTTELAATQRCGLGAFDPGRGVAASLAARCDALEQTPGIELVQELTLEGYAERECGPDEHGSQSRAAGSWLGTLRLASEESNGYTVRFSAETTPNFAGRCLLHVDDTPAGISLDSGRLPTITTTAAQLLVRIECPARLSEAWCYGQVPATAAPPVVSVDRLRLTITVEAVR